MTDHERERLTELLSEVVELLPQYECFIVTPETIMVSSSEKVQYLADSMELGLEIEEGTGIILTDEDFEDEGSGGLLH